MDAKIISHQSKPDACGSNAILERSAGVIIVVDVSMDRRITCSSNSGVRNEGQPLHIVFAISLNGLCVQVFGMEATQENVYGEVAPLVVSVMDGYNACIFAYGQVRRSQYHTHKSPPPTIA